MKTKIFVLAMLAVLALSHSGYADNKTLNNQVTSLIKKKEFDMALMICNKAIKKDSLDALAWLLKSSIFEIQKKYDETINTNKKLIEILTNNKFEDGLRKNILTALFIGNARIYALLNNRENVLLNLKKAIGNEYVFQNKDYKSKSRLKVVIKNHSAFQEYWDDPDFIELTKDTTKSE